MRFACLSALVGLSLALGCSSEPGSPGTGEGSGDPGFTKLGELPPVSEAPPILGAHMMKGMQADRHLRNPNMIFHNGPVLTTTVTEAIFWGTQWGNSTFAADKITGLDTWYGGFGGSGYAGTSDEYSGSNGKVTSTVSYAGHIVDTTAASGGNSTSAILAEVCKEIKSPVSNGYYAVYTDVQPGGSNYCAYHSNGTCGGKTVQFAFFWDLDGVAGCNPDSTVTGQSEGLQALANVSGHELSEARTDPDGTGWFDGSGAENGDKCAWSWPAGAPTTVKFSNNSVWKIQGEWSNAAYNAGTGFANLSGQHGCIF